MDKMRTDGFKKLVSFVVILGFLLVAVQFSAGHANKPSYLRGLVRATSSPPPH